MQRARLLVGCYRREDFADVQIASRAFIAVLARYPEDVVIKVTEPATGIPSKLKWPPSISEVVDACNAEMAPILREFDRKMVAYRQAMLLAAPPPGPKMTVAEMEAKLGRPLSGFAHRVEPAPVPRHEDGNHAARAAADLEARKRRSESDGLREAWRERREAPHEPDGLPEPPEAA